jgi:hypothetical protein
MSDGRLNPDTPIPGSTAGQTVGEFSAWAYSNILTNITRGLYAEFLVGTALGAVEGTRTETSHERVDDVECVELREGDSLRDLVPAAFLVRRIVEKGGSRKFRRRVPEVVARERVTQPTQNSTVWGMRDSSSEDIMIGAVGATSSRGKGAMVR